MPRYHVLHQYEIGLVSSDVPTSDYHPLTMQEIVALLEIAVRADAFTVSSIQVRLEQGIVGVTCPDIPESEAVRRQGLLDTCYMAHYWRGADPALVQYLFDCMHGRV